MKTYWLDTIETGGLMNRFLSMLTLAIISIFAISCDNSNLSNSDFIGEYEMTTEVITIYDDVEFDDNPIVKSNVAIYQEQNKLFVQTDCFGIPFIYGDDFNPSEIENQQPDDNSNSNIVDVKPNTSVVVLKNGLVRSIVYGTVPESLPIQVKSVTATKLVMKDSKPFEVTITDHAGERKENINCHFEYEPIFKQNETLSWELSLIPHQPIKDGTAEITAIKYKNILRKIK